MKPRFHHHRHHISLFIYLFCVLCVAAVEEARTEMSLVSAWSIKTTEQAHEL